MEDIKAGVNMVRKTQNQFPSKHYQLSHIIRVHES